VERKLSIIKNKNHSKYSQIAFYTDRIDTDGALTGHQPHLQLAGDRTFSPIFHTNIGDDLQKYRCFLHDVIQ
jgi:hypothetical protein